MRLSNLQVFVLRWLSCLAALACLPLAVSSAQESGAAATTSSSLSQSLQPFFQILSGAENKFSIAVNGTIPIDGKSQAVRLELTRYSDEAFELVFDHPDYAVHIRRQQAATAFALPKHSVVFVGGGEVDAHDHLSPLGVVERLLSGGTSVREYMPLMTSGNALSTLRTLSLLIPFEKQGDTNTWMIADSVRLDATPKNGKPTLHVTEGGLDLILTLGEVGEPQEVESWPGYETRVLARDEMERHLSRGVRRALEVLLPSAELTNPSEHPRKVAHGELRYVDGQRLVLLQGTPEQIGQAHGELLQIESQRCIDSVLYAFGTVQTVVTGRWFRSELEAAYARLKPHMPADHIAETRAMAASLGQDPAVIEALNVFPEMFHCSGFAVFDSATLDGKLYHGRVLDYMTTIGLQDCATTFVVSVDGKIPFANIGYAAFTGSVSGMNAQGVSLGEMGGRGEGAWDGVPMATLMRRAMEECSTLSEVKTLWASSPRTCEYYYVFADGKTNTAVGVAATPEEIQFVAPGESHSLLGEGIPDAIVLSAGERLETLRKRVQAEHGKIDADKAKWLMSRPVAMESNLHNVLFIPADGVFYVANASHKQPAAERPYVRYSLSELLQK